MTKQEQIEILERAIPLIDSPKRIGVCLSLGQILETSIFGADRFMDNIGIELPPMEFGEDENFCWPLTPEGDEARRQFLRDHIERLRKELTTP